MISLSIQDGKLLVEADAGELAPRHESQLAFWGFSSGSSALHFVSESDADPQLIEKVSKYLSRSELQLELAAGVADAVAGSVAAREALDAARSAASTYKAGIGEPEDAEGFLAFLENSVPRRLKQHQCKAAIHLLAACNGANFSVPGSGKTTVVLSVFEWLKRSGLVDALFVVGPPACFGPWRFEFEETLGYEPHCEMLAGGNIEDRRGRYLVDRDSVQDLYLTTFQTLSRDVDAVRVMFERQGVRFFLVIDEAHYIKKIDGAWASAALTIASVAERRCILTGTPFPRGLSDAFNLFDVLWPLATPISSEERTRVGVFSEQGEVDEALQILENTVGPLFYRVRKADLGLAPQEFHSPTLVQMKSHERFVYDSIVGRIHDASKAEYLRDHDTVLRLRRGRMMRLRQCVSFSALLSTVVDDYEEDLLQGDLSLAKIVRNYEALETPGKLDVLADRVADLCSEGRKVVVWSNFVRTLEKIKTTLDELGVGSSLIYGATPVESSGLEESITREGLIREFLDRRSGVEVLIANPGACAESISLHKACSHAIYYDLSYNCAQYLQSLDRIHRVGGSESTVAHYEFLLYENTVDSDILANLRRKADLMSRVVDEEYPVYGLDMFAFDEEIEAYERLFCT